jgi:hypothetical protein
MQSLKNATASSAAVIVSALMVFVGGREVPGKTGLDVPLVMTQAPREDRADLPSGPTGELVRAHRFEGGRIVIVSPEGQLRVLTEGFHSACDPSLSFDAKRLVFAGKKERSSPWRIYEMALDGTNLRPITPENQAARSPIYLSTLFTLDSPEPWFTILYVGGERTLNEMGEAAAASLYSIKLDGTELRRVTFNPNRNLDPFQMGDGRVLFAAERYPSEPGALAGRVSLYGINMEGTDAELYGAEQGGRVQRMPCATESGLVVFVEAETAARDGAGQLACVREQRPHQSYKKLTTDAARAYLHPSPWREAALLVSRRSSDGKDTCGVFLFDAATGRCDPVFDSPEYDELQAKAVQPRRQPDGRSTTVKPEVKTGTFYALNCYTAEERVWPHLTPGVFRRLRVIEGVPQAAGPAAPKTGGDGELPAYLADAARARGPFVPRRVLGTAPIESDGSFNIEVPADMPLLFQTLDARGLALGTCGWTWVKPKENRGCIGCHEDPELIPENTYALALRRHSDRVAPPVSERRSLGFKEAIVPILKIRCATAECHGSAETSFQLPLNADRPSEQDLKYSYAALLSPRQGGGAHQGPIPQRGKYVDPGRARTSFLVWQLFGTNTSRAWDHAPGEPPAGGRTVKLMPPLGKGGPLNEDEIRTLVEWIDLGAAWEALKPEELTAGL